MKDVKETNKKLFNKYLKELETALVNGEDGVKRYLKWLRDEFEISLDGENMYYVDDGIISVKHAVKANKIWQKILERYNKYKNKVFKEGFEEYLKGLAKDKLNEYDIEA